MSNTFTRTKTKTSFYSYPKLTPSIKTAFPLVDAPQLGHSGTTLAHFLHVVKALQHKNTQERGWT